MKVKINLMNSESNNKIALVTGASRGLGKYLSIELAKKGYDIILVARTVGALEEQYDEINKLGVKSTIVPLDLNEDNAKSAVEKLGSNASYVIANVTDESSVQSAVDKTVEVFGGLHVVVNCAGIGSASKTVGKNGAHPLDYFKTVVDINLNGTFNVLRLAAVAMADNEPN